MFKIRMQEWKRNSEEDERVLTVLACETRKVEKDGYTSKWKERHTFFLIVENGQLTWVDGEDYELVVD